MLVNTRGRAGKKTEKLHTYLMSVPDRVGSVGEMNKDVRGEIKLFPDKDTVLGLMRFYH